MRLPRAEAVFVQPHIAHTPCTVPVVLYSVQLRVVASPGLRVPCWTALWRAIGGLFFAAPLACNTRLDLLCVHYWSLGRGAVAPSSVSLAAATAGPTAATAAAATR